MTADWNAKITGLLTMDTKNGKLRINLPVLLSIFAI